MVAPFDWNLGWLPRDPVPVDAIPDIGENQQIVFTEWMGRLRHASININQSSIINNKLKAVTHHELWYRYVPESGNWHGGTLTRRIAALSAAPLSIVF